MNLLLNRSGRNICHYVALPVNHMNLSELSQFGNCWPGVIRKTNSHPLTCCRLWRHGSSSISCLRRKSWAKQIVSSSSSCSRLLRTANTCTCSWRHALEVNCGLYSEIRAILMTPPHASTQLVLLRRSIICTVATSYTETLNQKTCCST